MGWYRDRSKIQATGFSCSVPLCMKTFLCDNFLSSRTWLCSWWTAWHVFSLSLEKERCKTTFYVYGTSRDLISNYLLLPSPESERITADQLRTDSRGAFNLLCVCVPSLQSCPTLCEPMDCSPPGSSVHRILQGKNIGVGCHFLLQGIFMTQGPNLHLPAFPALQADSLPT